MTSKENFKSLEESVDKIVQVLIENEEFSYRDMLNKNLEILRDEETNLKAISIILDLCESERGLIDINFKTISYDDRIKLNINLSNTARSLNANS